MPKPEFEFFDPSDVPSQPIKPVEGLSEKILSHDPETGTYGLHAAKSPWKIARSSHASRVLARPL